MIAAFKKCFVLVLMVTGTSARLREAESESNLREAASERRALKGKPAPIKLLPVNLGTAGDFVILAKTGISTVPTSQITGDIGVSPAAATYLTGFALTLAGEYSTSGQVSGKCYASDYSPPTPTKMTTAISDMETAYLDAKGRPNADASRINLKGGNIGGETLTAGIYTFTTNIGITSDIYLQGSKTDVFIIQTTGVVTMADNVNVNLSGAVKASNVFWQVASQVVVGKGSVMKGVLLVKTDVTLATGATLIGRVYTQTACNLQMATVTKA